MLCICSVPCSSVGKALKVGVQTPPMPKILLLKKGFLGKFELRLSRNLKRFTLQGNAKHDACIKWACGLWFQRFKYLCIIPDEMHAYNGW